MTDEKLIIYQLLPRLFTNTCNACVPNGSIGQNSCGKFNDISSKVLTEIRNLGVTHVWYTGVIEHATATDYSEYGIQHDNPHIVKGKAGSPYAIKDYYDVDPDLAVNVKSRMAEFEALVARTHKAGLSVLIDFVPNHVARQYHSDAKPAGIDDLGKDDNTSLAFSRDNNFYYIPRQLFSPSITLGHGKDAYYEFPAKATGNDCFTAFPSANDWYETIKLNYGVDYGDGSTHFSPIPSTWFKMLNILRFWAGKGIDGFRCDMAHMVPVQFWKWAIPLVKEKYPRVIFIAEIYDVNLYRDYIYNGHFDYLYDKVTLYDTLRGIVCGNISAACLTSCWQTVDGISSHMLNFLENHDEQRFASMQYAGDAMKALPSLVVSATISNCPMLIYAGQELGEKASAAEGFSGYDGRTSIFDYWSVPSIRRWFNDGKCDGGQLSAYESEVREMYARVLHICRREKAICQGGFFDLMYVNYDNPALNPHRQFAYLRHYEDETLLIAVNFAITPCDLKINIPAHAFTTLDMRQGDVVATDLLTGEKQEFLFCVNSPVPAHIKPFNAVILKICYAQRKASAKKV